MNVLKLLAITTVQSLPVSSDSIPVVCHSHLPSGVHRQSPELSQIALRHFESAKLSQDMETPRLFRRIDDSGSRAIAELDEMSVQMKELSVQMKELARLFTQFRIQLSTKRDSARVSCIYPS